MAGQRSACRLSMAKRILQCPTRTSGEAARGELGWMRMDARYQLARVLFWGKLHLMPADTPARLVFEASAAAHALTDAADGAVPDAAAAEGWPVSYAQPTRHGLVPWCAQLKLDLHQLGLRAAFDDPSAVLARWTRHVAAESARRGAGTGTAALVARRHRFAHAAHLRHTQVRTRLTAAGTVPHSQSRWLERSAVWPADAR